ncbi:MAG TPA: glycoside hydrolase family 3 N-terminal domain-containing protein [Ktedonobacteraceae bacterium]|nr:glycoside hydrolase family 3 N-terminal domain-containing protein [Ktedonobacteraceae bacterium]
MSQIRENSAASADSAESDSTSRPPAPRPGSLRRRRRFVWLALCVLLVLLVIPGINAANYLLFAKKPVVSTANYSGPFAMLPLSQGQLYEIEHLPERLQAKQLAQLYLSHMTLDEKLGQLFMVQALTYNDSANTPDTMYMLNQLHAGGIIMYAIQMNTFKQARGDIQQMQHNASIPLLIAADEEGGFVERVQKIFGHRPGALEVYRTGDVNKATQLGQSITHDLRSLGINTDLAPDVDVQQVDGPDQYLRTWGYTPASVIKFGGAYLRAVQDAGEIAALKHFPGLGAATTDAHTSLPVIKSTKDHIYATDLAPYQYFLSSADPLNNPGMIMTTDLMMPALDPTLPAELSPAIITGILRNQFHYDGVVITDALWMDGIAKKWNLVQASLMALNAGCDMLLGAIGSYQMHMVLNGLKAALASGQLSMDRVNQAVTRIIALKFQYHILPVPWYS